MTSGSATRHRRWAFPSKAPLDRVSAPRPSRANRGYRVEAMASRIAHLLVIGTLFTSLVLNDPARARLAQQLTADVLSEHRY